MTIQAVDGDDTIPARLEAAGTCNTGMAYSTLGSVPGARTLIQRSPSFDLGFEVESWLGFEAALGFASRPLLGLWNDGLEWEAPMKREEHAQVAFAR